MYPWTKGFTVDPRQIETELPSQNKTKIHAYMSPT